jgi:hypothetical protein
VDRAILQALAEERVLAAQALLAAKQWSSAYYLAGYAVELGLKSCVLVQVAANIGILFDDRKLSDKCFSHSIKDLVILAGLEDTRKVDIGTNPAFDKNWSIVLQWNEKSRYQMKTPVAAEELLSAIVDNANGVMPWIRSRW